MYSSTTCQPMVKTDWTRDLTDGNECKLIDSDAEKMPSDSERGHVNSLVQLGRGCSPEIDVCSDSHPPAHGLIRAISNISRLPRRRQGTNGRGISRPVDTVVFAAC